MFSSTLERPVVTWIYSLPNCISILPQMAPMSWLILYIYFTLSFLAVMAKIYFLF